MPCAEPTSRRSRRPCADELAHERHRLAVGERAAERHRVAVAHELDRVGEGAPLVGLRARAHRHWAVMPPSAV